MANNCFIEISLETENAEQAEELRKELQTSFAIARRENVGAFFGNDKRYLFDAHCDQAATEVSIGGWVKWGYSDDEFTEMFRWLKSKANIKKFRMAYEELMTDQYGEYELHADGVMWNNFLEEKDFPTETDDFDLYCEKVEETFRKNPTTRFIEVG